MYRKFIQLIVFFPLVCFSQVKQAQVLQYTDLLSTDSPKSKKICIIPEFSIVDVIGVTKTGFYKVKYNGKIGFVDKNSIPSTKVPLIQSENKVVKKPKQNSSVTDFTQIMNLHFNQSDDMIIVYYDLIGDEIYKYKVQLFYIINGELRGPAKSVIGDIGINIKPGKSKRIEWHVLKDSNSIEGEIKVKIQAERM